MVGFFLSNFRKALLKTRSDHNLSGGEPRNEGMDQDMPKHFGFREHSVYKNMLGYFRGLLAFVGPRHVPIVPIVPIG